MKPRQPAVFTGSMVPNPTARHTPVKGALADKDDRKIDSRLVCVQTMRDFLYIRFRACGAFRFRRMPILRHL